MCHEYACDRCDFHFASEISLAEGAANAVCTACAQSYRIVWPPDAPAGEYARLLIQNRHISPVHIEDTARRAFIDTEHGEDFLVLKTGDLHCMNCNTAGSIATALQDGAPCPGCREGKIIDLEKTGV